MKTYTEFMTEGDDFDLFAKEPSADNEAWVAEAGTDDDMATVTIHREDEPGKYTDMGTAYYRDEDGVLVFDAYENNKGSSSDAKKIQKVVNAHVDGATFNNVREIEKQLTKIVDDLKKTMK